MSFLSSTIPYYNSFLICLDYCSELRQHIHSCSSSAPINKELCSELSQYLSTGPENMKDPLLWWVEMHAVYPCFCKWHVTTCPFLVWLFFFFKLCFQELMQILFLLKQLPQTSNRFSVKATLSFPMSITNLAWHWHVRWCVSVLGAGSDWCERLISKPWHHCQMLLERKTSLSQVGTTWPMIKYITCTPAYNILTHASTPDRLLTLATPDKPVPTPVNYPDPHGGYGFW